MPERRECDHGRESQEEMLIPGYLWCERGYSAAMGTVVGELVGKIGIEAAAQFLSAVPGQHRIRAGDRCGWGANCALCASTGRYPRRPGIPLSAMRVARQGSADTLRRLPVAAAADQGGHHQAAQVQRPACCSSPGRGRAGGGPVQGRVCQRGRLLAPTLPRPAAGPGGLHRLPRRGYHAQRP